MWERVSALRLPMCKTNWVISNKKWVLVLPQTHRESLKEMVGVWKSPSILPSRFLLWLFIIFLNLYWRAVDRQGCVILCCTAKGTSHTHMYTRSLPQLSTLIGHHRVWDRVPCVYSRSIYLTFLAPSCRILIPQPGIELAPSPVEVRNLNWPPGKSLYF